MLVTNFLAGQQSQLAHIAVGQTFVHSLALMGASHLPPEIKKTTGPGN
jgi:hypothetical protein